jgi:hypothetical protein
VRSKKKAGKFSSEHHRKHPVGGWGYDWSGGEGAVYNLLRAMTRGDMGDLAAGEGLCWGLTVLGVGP